MPGNGDLHLLTPILERLNWPGWESVIETHGIEIDRRRGTPHPHHPEIIYPIDYGYIRGTLGTEGDELDVFVGTTTTKLAGAIFTADYRRGDRECKLLYNVTPQEVYLINGFINFDRRLMEGVLVMRTSMSSLWSIEHSSHESGKRESR